MFAKPSPLRQFLRRPLAILATFVIAITAATWSTEPAKAALSYNFTSWTFTPCGATGRTGPTLAQCQTAYAASSFASNSSYFAVSNSGSQYWRPPTAGNYTIEIAGAAGGGTNGANGYVYQISLNLSTVYTGWYCMDIGQKGIANTNFPESGGGGGGTYGMLLGLGNSTNPTGTCGASTLLNIGAAGGGGGGSGTNRAPNPDGIWDSTGKWDDGSDGTGDKFVGKSGKSRNLGGSPNSAGGSLTGAGGNHVTPRTGNNTGAGSGAAVVATSGGDGYNSTGGTFGLGLGGDGGFPDGGASCGCYTNGGGGGGGGGVSGSGGGGFFNDGSAGAGGYGASYQNFGNLATMQAISLGAINTGDGYIKITYDDAISGSTFVPVSGNYAVGQTLTASPVTLAQASATPTISWRWQSNDVNTPAGFNNWVDIPGATSTTFTPDASLAGKYVRAVESITSGSDGVTVQYVSVSNTNWPVAYTHAISTANFPTTWGQNTTFGYTFTDTGFAYNSGTGWSKVSGTLPPGTAMAASGNLSGTANTAGTYTFTIGHDNFYSVATQTFTIVIKPTVTFAVTLPGCTSGAAYSYTLSATSPGGETLTYSLSGGTLPSTLTLNQTTGVISGTCAEVTTVTTTNLSFDAFYPDGNRAAQSGIKSIVTQPKTASATPTVSFSNLSSSTFFAATPTTVNINFSNPGAGSGVFRVSSNTPSICAITTDPTVSPATIQFSTYGTCSINVFEAGDATYNSITRTVTQTVSGRAQASNTFTWGQTGGSLQWVAGGITVTVGATGGNGTGAFIYTTSPNPWCSVDPVTGVVTFFAPVTCNLSASKAGDAEFTAYSIGGLSLTPIGISQTVPVVINGAPASVDWTSGGTFTVTASGGSWQLASKPSYTFQSQTTTICTVGASTGVVTIVNAGTCSIAAMINATGGWAASSYGPATDIAINGTAQADLAIAVNNGNPPKYSGGSFPVVVSGGSGTGSISYSSTTTTLCTGSGTGTTIYLTPLKAGTCSVSITKAPQGGYYSKTQVFDISVGLAAQSNISVSLSPSSLTFTAAGPTTTVTGSFGNGTGAWVSTIDSTTSSVCSVSGNIVTALTAGLCKINTYKSGDTQYA
ncbi:MAG: hypothetical protein RLZZ400_291, partial [Actinomycetota bacterium]